MVKLIPIISVVVLALVLGSHARGLGKKNPRIDTCTESACALPNCLCSNIEIPGGLDDSEIPQIVFLTFDDGVTTSNYPLYQEIFDGTRLNPNDAPISATFFVTHEYNDYSLTHELYRQDHEVALHSITHKSDVSYWKNLNASMWKLEVADQREQMSMFAKIPINKLEGFRAPFLQGGGDVMYDVLDVNASLRYESSRPSWRWRPALWPYTSNFETIQDCQIEPCPVESHDGFWVHPLVDFLGNNSQPCAMVDTCLPQPESVDDTYELLMRNFQDHYKSGKAPFGVYTHAAWILNNEKPFIKTGYLKFIDEILKLDDVYIVSISKGLDWIQHPTTLDGILAGNLTSWEAPAPIANDCRFPISCTYNATQLPPGLTGERLMKTCTLCPKTYPWLGNFKGT